MAANVGDWNARFEALSGRVDASLVRARRSREPVVGVEIDEHARLELEALAVKLHAAETDAVLHQQRGQALEDRVAELTAALVGATEQRHQAEALAESARQQADRALDQLEATLREEERSTVATHVDTQLADMLQTKLLEVERLTTELTALRRSNDDWRTKARTYRRDLDRVSVELQQASSQLAEVRARDESSRSRLGELERLVAEQRRELEIAERRAQHLRAHMR